MVCRTAINQSALGKPLPTGENILILKQRKPSEAEEASGVEGQGRFVELKFDDPPPKGGRPG